MRSSELKEIKADVKFIKEILIKKLIDKPHMKVMKPQSSLFNFLRYGR